MAGRALARPDVGPLASKDGSCDSGTVLTVIGDLVEDIVVWTAGPQRAGTDNPATVTRSRGGSAANVAARAATLAPTRFVGRVGDDPAGAWLESALAASGVDVRVQRGGRSGSVVVLVDPADGERTMFPDRAAAAELAPIDHNWLTGTTLLHVPSYGFETDPTAASIIGAIEYVRRRGGRLAIDVSAVTVVESLGRERFGELLDALQPEIVFANVDEADTAGLWSRRPPPGGAFVVKDGPRPARMLLSDGSEQTVDALSVHAVRDTTGAGDAFAAGFLTAWQEGAGPLAACRSGHAVAASVLSTVGAA